MRRMSGWWLSPRLVTVGAVGGVLSFTVLFVLTHSYCIYDDAYIYFRFVENVFRGCALEYSCGQGRVEGFTSPLYFGLLLLARLVTVDLESAAQVIGMVSIAATLTVAATMAMDQRWSVLGSVWTTPGAVRDESLGTPAAVRLRWVSALRGAGVALLLGLDHHFLLNTVVGMETGLAALVGLLVLRSALSPRRRGLRTCAVLAVFVRPEFGLLFPLLPFFPEARRIRYWWPILIVGAATVACRYALFADIMPNPFWAKTGGTVEHARLGVKYLAKGITTFPVLAAAPLALVARELRRPALYFVTVIAVWLAWFLYSGGDFYPYARMAVPLVPAAAVLSVAGLNAALEIGWALVRRVRYRPLHRQMGVAADKYQGGVLLPPVPPLTGPEGDRSLRVQGDGALPPGPRTSGYEGSVVEGLPSALPSVFPVSACTLGIVLTWALAAAWLHHIPEQHGFENVEKWGALGRYFARAHPGAPVAATAVGALGYYNMDAPIIDIVGIVDRTVAKEGSRAPKVKIGHSCYFVEHTLSLKPEFIVFLNAWKEQPWSKGDKVEVDIYGEWLLLRAALSGAASYEPFTPEIAPGVHWFLLRRKP